MNSVRPKFLLLALAMLSSSVLHAEPVTLVFTGIVDYRSEYAPSSIQAGSVVSGQISYDTALLPSQPPQVGTNLQNILYTVAQPGAFQVQVGDQSLMSSDMQVVVRDVTGASTTYEQIGFKARNVTVNGEPLPTSGGLLEALNVGLELRTANGVESVLGASLPATLGLQDFARTQGGMTFSVAVSDEAPGSGFWSVSYNLTSISAVPEASAMSSMVLGCLMLGAVACRQARRS